MLKHILIYLFPLFVSVRHYLTQKLFVEENIIFYLLGFALLVYTHISSSKDKNTEKFFRKIYFVYTYFFLLYIFPEIDKYNIWHRNVGILNLSTSISTSIAIFIISFIIYITIISDFHISEISFGNANAAAQYFLKQLKEFDVVSITGCTGSS